MLPVPVFLSWRAHWDQNETIKKLANDSDSIAVRRNHVRNSSTTVRDLHRFAPRLHHFQILRREKSERLKEEKPAALYRSYLVGISEFRPLIEAARWSRWLLLEQALADAMQHGDQLFAALVLRTQIEDLGTHLRLEQIENQLKDLKTQGEIASDLSETLISVEEMIDFLWQHFLPRLQPATPEEMAGKKRNDSTFRWPNELAESFSSE